jgi:lipoprotein-anchoring transpeptidase ErfK/SrfK
MERSRQSRAFKRTGEPAMGRRAWRWRATNIATARARRADSNSVLETMMTSQALRALIAGAALVAGIAVATPTAVAQDSGWLWGGGSTWGGAGRETVRFGGAHAPGQVVVSFTDRRLYFVVRPGEALSYPIAIPREQSRWSGVTSVTQKRENPSWTPTPNMIAENPRLPRWVPGGHPMNPLGVRALYLGSSAYRIHGTDAPWTIGAAVSKGCIRMYNQDVLDLYPRVRVGAKVIVTWDSFRGRGGPTTASGDEAGPSRRTYNNAKRRVPRSADAGTTRIRSAAVSQ